MGQATDTDTLQLESERVGGGKCKVTARWQGKVVHIDIIDPASAPQRRRFVKALAEKLPAANPESIDAELLRLADAISTSADQGEADKPLDDGPELRAEVESLLREPELIRVILDDIAALGVAGEGELTATIYLTGVSRLLEKPLALIIKGPSSSGKSFIIEKTAELFPPEAVILATQMTAQALFYMAPGSLSHRFVVCGERSRVEEDDRAEATRALREMLSAGRLSKLVPVKTGNEIKTVLIEQEGPIAYVESTTLTNIFDEDANRCLLVNTDERAEQTQRIIRTLAAGYGGRAVPPDQRDAIRRRHHCLQRLLEAVPVVIPFAERVADLFSMRCVEARRAFPQLMNMVEAVALLYQRQRDRDGNGCLIADPQDYQVARHLLLKPLSRYKGSITDGARRFYDALRERVGKEFTSTDAREKEENSRSSVYGWLNELHDAGLLELVEPSKGRIPARWRMTEADPAEVTVDQTTLPRVEDVFPRVPSGHMGATAN